ncbi:hypothetical protein E2C01_063966 [Portunus trituberculatus]|uniref:Uncharacterized protein n=1 Tax=Portunus trituberculatus TaxID=210409 RepID=A0A5B7HJL0_PORTR|nr:hypothetical protein [Portunus trituberculatus]
MDDQECDEGNPKEGRSLEKIQQEDDLTYTSGLEIMLPYWSKMLNTAWSWASPMRQKSNPRAFFAYA